MDEVLDMHRPMDRSSWAAVQFHRYHSNDREERMPRMPRFSPYGPRPKRSARIVMLWVAVLLLILGLTFYLTTRDGEPSRVDTKVVMEKIRGRRGPLSEKNCKSVP
ncbi:hypothetical protein F4808DRAFT_462521 [Astrocystis sublimbata]|nr:hypothetical protein F4808DRAFT_462521 [Astrocystis sublimbata]